MAKRDQLRNIRKGTVINVSSKKMESDLIKALRIVEEKISRNYDVPITWEDKIKLSLIVDDLRKNYPEIDFFHFFDSTFLKPDGGILYITDLKGNRYPILIAEAKRQGTNDLRAKEGLEKQARGNAIERLGKNLIGFRTWLAHEDIFPFVVFGEGNDFSDESSILDRVVTMSMFAPLNRIELISDPASKHFKRGSFFFREKSWTVSEIHPILHEIADNSLKYYLDKYGSANFVQS